jgi:hypothetical protein
LRVVSRLEHVFTVRLERVLAHGGQRGALLVAGPASEVLGALVLLQHALVGELAAAVVAPRQRRLALATHGAENNGPGGVAALCFLSRYGPFLSRHARQTRLAFRSTHVSDGDVLMDWI